MNKEKIEEVNTKMGKMDEIFDDVVDLIKGAAMLILFTGVGVATYKILDWFISLV